LFSKIEVNGSGACELYDQLKAAHPGDIGWNFTKFLVDRSGNVVKRYEPQTTPEDIEAEIRALL